jgi:hypothetical protein
MLIYHTSQLSGAKFEPCDCNRDSLDREAHVCFTSVPLAGHGPWLYVLEVPESVLRTYEYSNPLHPQSVRYFALPLSVASSYEAHEYPYEALVGSSWREWDLVLRDPADPHDKWSRLWVSRVGVATAVRKVEAGVEKAHVELTGLFDPSMDYVIVEHQKYGGRAFELELLAGTMPGWADFPSRWHAWANDPENRRSALDYIMEVAPETRSELLKTEYRSRGKLEKIQGWRRVAGMVSSHINRDLGQIPAGSHTSVQAMPLRIAQRIGGWNPTLPKPEFESPESSGRVMLAAPTNIPPRVNSDPRQGPTDMGGSRSPSEPSPALRFRGIRASA